MRTKSFEVTYCRVEATRTASIELIGEEPLLIRIEDKPYCVVMRTPGEEIFHVAGFCLGEGIVDSPNDFLAIKYCRDGDPNVIEVKLKRKRVEMIGDLLQRRGFVSQTGCGICGKEMLKDLCQTVTPLENGPEVEVTSIFNCIDKLSQHQKYYEATRGSHAALILDGEMNTLSFAEDVGRHNALDKAVGKAFMAGNLPKARIAILSSRISYELVQKAARARIPMIVSDSRPTALAIEIGKALNMTLAFPTDKSDLVVACGPNRILVK